MPPGMTAAARSRHCASWLFALKDRSKARIHVRHDHTRPIARRQGSRSGRWDEEGVTQ
jgi:hypothetical protein